MSRALEIALETAERSLAWEQEHRPPKFFCDSTEHRKGPSTMPHEPLFHPEDPTAAHKARVRAAESVIAGVRSRMDAEAESLDEAW